MNSFLGCYSSKSIYSRFLLYLLVVILDDCLDIPDLRESG